MLDIPNSKILNEIITPVYSNVLRSQDSFDVYNVLTKHAAELNKTHHKMFFALTQRMAIDHTLICLCKLYDSTCDAYDKHTIPILLQHVKAAFCIESLQRTRPETLTALGISEKKTTGLLNAHNEATFVLAKERLFRLIECKRPTESNTRALKDIFTIRHKALAHQENLFLTGQHLPEEIPSSKEIKRLISWAADFCSFATEALCKETLLFDSVRSAKTATLKIVAIALDKDFSGLNGLQEMMGYYRSADD